jgi:hypothetical protein
MTLSLATMGGGCFWCTEALFQQVRGVKSVVTTVVTPKIQLTGKCVTVQLGMQKWFRLNLMKVR